MDKIVFEHSNLNIKKLLDYGFKLLGERYFNSFSILDGQFSLEIFVSADGIVETRLTDTGSDEEYILHLVEECTGAFVAEVRAAYRLEILKLKNFFFDTVFFNVKQTGDLVNYIKTTYQVEPEFLWDSTPDGFIFRRKDNRKWFALFLTVKRDRLSLSGKEKESIVVFRADPAQIPLIIDQKKYFAGYHMNKKHWLTAILNGSISLEELALRIDESYRLAKK